VWLRRQRPSVSCPAVGKSSRQPCNSAQVSFIVGKRSEAEPPERRGPLRREETRGAKLATYNDGLVPLLRFRVVVVLYAGQSTADCLEILSASWGRESVRVGSAAAFLSTRGSAGGSPTSLTICSRRLGVIGCTGSLSIFDARIDISETHEVARSCHVVTISGGWVLCVPGYLDFFVCFPTVLLFEPCVSEYAFAEVQISQDRNLRSVTLL
jgi:hypothetical protein